MLEEYMYMKVEYMKQHKSKKKKAFTVALIDTSANSDGKKDTNKKKVSLMTAHLQ